MHTSRVVTSLVVLFVGGCASLGHRDGAVVLLSEDERQVLAAVLQDEAALLERPRPVLVLTPTDPWMPLETNGPLPRPLRKANGAAYDLTGVALPVNATLYPRDQFEREYQSDEGFRNLVERLGGVEPLVLSFSRPGLEMEDESAHVLSHVLATWSGCGGINYFTATRSQTGWKPELAGILVIW